MTESSFAARYLMLARQRLRAGDARGAIEQLRRVLSEDPSLAEAHALLAYALYNAKRVYAARVECDQALALEPENITAHLAAALVAIAERKPALAQEHVDAAVALSPDNANSYEVQARVCELRGDRAGEHAALEKALSLAAEDTEIMAKLGFLHLRQRQYPRALELAQHALENEPENATALCLMGYVHLADGDIEAARDHAIWALRNGKQEGALRLLAAIKAKQSLLLGVWWRYSVWLQALGEARIAFVLVGSYLVYRVASVFARSRGSEAADLVDDAWYAICIYSWVAPSLFQRSLRRELDQIKLRSDF
jgi:Flp pilus assembly protein TadD